MSLREPTPELVRQVVLFVRGAFEALHSKGLVAGSPGLTPRGMAAYDQLRASGFRPTAEEVGIVLRDHDVPEAEIDNMTWLILNESDPTRPNRSPIGRRRTFTRDGFPWPVRTRVFHATSALDAIAHEGFRTRAQGVSSALGGNWGRSVSFTLSWPRAGAIALGLDTLVRGARKVMSCVELAERLLDEVPESLVWGVRNGNLQEIATATDDRSYLRQLIQALGYLDRGWWLLRSFDLGEWRPNVRGAMRVSNKTWLIPPEAASTPGRRHAISRDLYLWTDYVKAFYELYRSPLSTASHNQEAFNPIWMIDDPHVLHDRRIEDVGIVVARLQIPRVCTDSTGAARLGYVDPSRLDYSEKSLIETAERSCRPALEAEPGDFSWEHDRKAAETSIRSWGRLPELRGWTVIDEGLRRRQDTMLFHNREEELIVYDPSRVRVERVIRMPEIRDAFDLGDRVTFPWFDDDDVDVRVIR